MRIYLVVLAALLVAFALLGSQAWFYVPALLAVPLVSGALAGRGTVAFWLAATACVLLVLVDISLDSSRGSDVVFFVILTVVLIGLAGLAFLVTGWLRRRTSARQGLSGG